MFDEGQYRYIQQCYRFTDRQMQIIKLLFAGLNNRAVAKKLKIRYNTVKAHFGHVYARVGAEDKSDLVIQLSRIAQTYKRAKKR